MLEQAIKEQLKGVFELLEHDYILETNLAKDVAVNDELVELIEEVCSCSAHLSIEKKESNDFSLQIISDEKGKAQFEFKAVPTGHEFSSLILAILNMDGKGKNIPDDFIIEKIKKIQGKHHLKTYISLSCTNCPEVVQALNLISILNPNIFHSVIDGGIYPDEIKQLNLHGVPAVYCEDELLNVGKASLSLLIERLEKKWGTSSVVEDVVLQEYDILVLGAGPAGASAAIYSARKGLKVGIIAEHIGGQVRETVGIENLISTTYITGQELTQSIKKHLEAYPIRIYENRKICDFITENGEHTVHLTTGEKFKAQAYIIATGARWRELNVPGEKEYIGQGVAFCPHCDGPFYKGKPVAVVGGGNSGIEAAIDLAGICSKVTVIEFLEDLKADNVLQENAQKQDNIEIFTNRQVKAIVGDGKHVVGIRVENRETGIMEEIPISAVFVQIGLVPNSQLFKDSIDIIHTGEIKIDERCRTNAKGIYAAGDVSSVPYKQIIIAMGEGAKAALSAFEDRIKGEL